MNKVLKPSLADQENVFPNAKKLLHFGTDWISFNISLVDSRKPSPSFSFLESLFRLPHNDTNASEYDSVVWGNTETEVMLEFSGKIQMGEVLSIKGHKGKAILRVVKIDPEWAKNIHYKFQYRIDCYGTLFDYDRLGLLNAREILSLFLLDIEQGLLRHSVSRVDICADFSGYTVKSIFRGIIGSKAHMKKKTIFNADNPETLNYGEKKDKWMARAYNKVLDARKKAKEWIFLRLGYFDCEPITRLEVEARSDMCLNNSLTLPLCFDHEYLFGIYKRLLRNKLVQFQIIPFLEKELKKRNFRIILPKKREHDPKRLSEEKYIKRIKSSVENAMERYEISFENLVEMIRPDHDPLMGKSLNSEILEKTENISTIPSHSSS